MELAREVADTGDKPFGDRLKLLTPLKPRPNNPVFGCPTEASFTPMTDYHTDGVVPRPLCAKRRHGFTMIELIVVVAIMAIVTTAAVYSYATFRNYKGVDVSSALIEQSLLQARNRLITLNRIQEIRIDLDRDTIWVDQLNPATPPAVGLVRVPYVVPEASTVDFVEIISVRVNGGAAVTTGIVDIQLEPGELGPLILIELKRGPDDPADDENYTTIRVEPGSLDVEVLRRTRIP